jgi:hypothetical protein
MIQLLYYFGNFWSTNRLVCTNLEFQLEHGHFCVAGQEKIELVVFAGIAPGPVRIHCATASAKIFVITHFTTVTPDVIAPVSHVSIQIDLVRKVPYLKIVIDVYSILGKMATRVSAVYAFDCVLVHNTRCSK